MDLMGLIKSNLDPGAKKLHVVDVKQTLSPQEQMTQPSSAIMAADR
jgi:hypothetical protein